VVSSLAPRKKLNSRYFTLQLEAKLRFNSNQNS